MTKKTMYTPNIAIHPGETLRDFLSDKKMSQKELAERTGLTPKTINEIIKGANPITQETALKLEYIFSMSATFWNNLQTNFEETVARLAEETQFKKELKLAKKYTCYNELANLDFVKKTRIPKERAKNLLRFFSVSSLEFVADVNNVAYRQSKSGNSSSECISAWLRCGEIQADKIDTEPFDSKKILSSVNRLRQLTTEPTSVYSKELKNICAKAGIALVFTPLFKKTSVNGATRWLTKDKALIQMSTRGSQDDIFWFTFFHELGHILKHGKLDKFIEFKKKKHVDEKEKEADKFAENTLIPSKMYTKFISLADYSTRAIKDFANSIGITASIVAGRLAREKKIPWEHTHSFRKKLSIQST